MAGDEAVGAWLGRACRAAARAHPAGEGAGGRGGARPAAVVNQMKEGHRRGKPMWLSSSAQG